MARCSRIRKNLYGTSRLKAMIFQSIVESCLLFSYISTSSSLQGGAQKSESYWSYHSENIHYHIVYERQEHI